MGPLKRFLKPTTPESNLNDFIVKFSVILYSAGSLFALAALA